MPETSGRGAAGASLERTQVVVIGAGAAGLTAARRLQQQGVDFLLVEAGDALGGRVKQVEGTLPWPVETGPEFIHGANSSLKRLLIDEMGCSYVEKGWPDWYYWGKERALVRGDADDPEIEALHDWFSEVGREPLPARDVTALDWLRAKGASDKQVAFADACYANDFGASIAELGLRELIVENRRWDAGETYLILDRSLREMVAHMARGMEDRIRTRWPVTRVLYEPRGSRDGGVVVLGPGGSAIWAQRCIVAVPLTQLKSGAIAFAPELPASKRAAIERLKMGNALKVILAFNERFWPGDMYDVVCTHSFVPEFWMTRYPAPGSEGGGDDLHGVTAFFCGSFYDRVKGMGQADVVRGVLAQLDAIFGTADRPRPATAALVRSHVADWAREKYIGGAYSYPTFGARVGDRAALRAPAGGVLFFAGEACHDAVNPCLQAAIETGEMAAAHAAASLRDPPRAKL